MPSPARPCKSRELLRMQDARRSAADVHRGHCDVGFALLDPGLLDQLVDVRRHPCICAGVVHRGEEVAAEVADARAEGNVDVGGRQRSGVRRQLEVLHRFEVLQARPHAQVVVIEAVALEVRRQPGDVPLPVKLPRAVNGLCRIHSLSSVRRTAVPAYVIAIGQTSRVHRHTPERTAIAPAITI